MTARRLTEQAVFAMEGTNWQRIRAAASAPAQFSRACARPGSYAYLDPAEAACSVEEALETRRSLLSAKELAADGLLHGAPAKFIPGITLASPALVRSMRIRSQCGPLQVRLLAAQRSPVTGSLSDRHTCSKAIASIRALAREAPHVKLGPFPRSTSAASGCYMDGDTGDPLWRGYGCFGLYDARQLVRPRERGW